MAGSKLPDGVPEKEEPPSFPGAVTYYFPVNLGGVTGYGEGSATGVFFPKDFVLGTAKLDIVLFFHGDKEQWNTVQDFWKPGNKKFIALRESINDAGKKLVLIAPTMGWDPDTSGKQTGILDENGKSADLLLDQVMDFIKQKVPEYKDKAKPEVGKIVLAAHSAGGQTLLRQTMLMRKYIANIRACWGFDCTYNWPATAPNVDNWIKWIRFRGDVENVIYYMKGTTRETIATGIQKIADGKDPLPDSPKGKPIFQKMTNIRTWGSVNEHYNQMNDNFPDLIEQLA